MTGGGGGVMTVMDLNRQQGLSDIDRQIMEGGVTWLNSHRSLGI